MFTGEPIKQPTRARRRCSGAAEDGMFYPPPGLRTWGMDIGDGNGMEWPGKNNRALGGNLTAYTNN